MKRPTTPQPLPKMLVLATLLTAAAAGAAESKPRKYDPWADFAPGSWVIVQDKGTSGDQSQTRKTKTSVAAVEEGVAWLEERQEANGVFAPASGTSHSSGADIASLPRTATRQETLKIGEKEVSCTVHEYVHELKEKSLKRRIVVWKTDALKVPYRELDMPGSPRFAIPSDVVRIDYSFEDGDASGSYAVKVVSLDDKLTVGQQAVKCVREEGEVKSRRRGEEMTGTLRRWLSDDMPGREVKLVLKGTAAGREVTRERQVLEFKASKPGG